MVRCNLGASLYSKVYAEVEAVNKVLYDRYIDAARPCSSIAIRSKHLLESDTPDNDLLVNITALWKAYQERVRLLENVLMFLDRCYILQKPELLSVQ